MSELSKLLFLFLPSWVWNLYLGQVKYLNVYASFVLIIIFSLWKKIFGWLLTNHKRLCSKSEMTKVLTFKECSLPDPTVHGILQARILEWVVIPSLLQEIFTTQGLNSGLLNCRQILYHLSHQGSLNFFPMCLQTFICIHILTYLTILFIGLATTFFFS